MLKLLLISVSLIFVSCDNDSPTEVSGLIESVCGYDNFEYLAGRGDACSSPGYIAEDIANIYCELAGYTSSVEYDVFTTTTHQNVLAWTGNIQVVTCDNIGYHGSVPGQFGANMWCPIISNLVCE